MFFSVSMQIFINWNFIRNLNIFNDMQWIGKCTQAKYCNIFIHQQGFTRLHRLRMCLANTVVHEDIQELHFGIKSCFNFYNLNIYNNCVGYIFLLWYLVLFWCLLAEKIFLYHKSPWYLLYVSVFNLFYYRYFLNLFKTYTSYDNFRVRVIEPTLRQKNLILDDTARCLTLS